MAEDKRITEVWDDQEEALTNIEESYGGMISNVDSTYKDQADKLAEGTEGIKNAANESLNTTIAGIEQNKKDSHTDYIKEQSGAYVDFMKQSNQYGANAEKNASMGLTGTGYSESSQVAMYNQWQNRVATAKMSYDRIIAGYNQAIAEAKAQNSSALAQIEYDSLREQLQILIQGFQYKNTLILEKAKAEREIKSEYYNRYLGVLDQIYKEKALAQEKEQFEKQLAEEQRQFNILHGSSAVQKYDSPIGPQKASSSNSSNSSSISKSTSSGGNQEQLKKDVISKFSGNVYDSGTYYIRATQFMKDNGLSDGGQRLLTSQEWAKNKKVNQGLSSEYEYSSYKEYVKNYLLWRVEES